MLRPLFLFWDPLDKNVLVPEPAKVCACVIGRCTVTRNREVDHALVAGIAVNCIEKRVTERFDVLDRVFYLVHDVMYKKPA